MPEIWDNPMSRRLDKKGRWEEALLFRVMNLSGKISLLFLVLGLLQAVFVLDRIAADVFSLLHVLPQAALICLILSSAAFAAFSFAAAGVAYLRKDYWWAAGMVALNILSVPYLLVKVKGRARAKARKKSSGG